MRNGFILVGIGLGIFGAIMETIYFFRPVTLDVSNVFLALVCYMLGTFLEWAIPKSGAVGRLFNPHPFNMKEHAAMVVIALSAAQTALAVEVIAAQRLFYDAAPNVILSILIVISSQCLGYVLGVVGWHQESGDGIVCGCVFACGRGRKARAAWVAAEVVGRAGRPRNTMASLGDFAESWSTQRRWYQSVAHEHVARDPASRPPRDKIPTALLLARPRRHLLLGALA